MWRRGEEEMARGLNAIGRGSAVSRERIQWSAPATAGTTNDTPRCRQGGPASVPRVHGAASAGDGRQS